MILFPSSQPDHSNPTRQAVQETAGVSSFINTVATTTPPPEAYTNLACITLIETLSGHARTIPRTIFPLRSINLRTRQRCWTARLRRISPGHARMTTWSARCPIFATELSACKTTSITFPEGRGHSRKMTRGGNWNENFCTSCTKSYLTWRGGLKKTRQGKTRRNESR